MVSPLCTLPPHTSVTKKLEVEGGVLDCSVVMILLDGGFVGLNLHAKNPDGSYVENGENPFGLAINNMSIWSTPDEGDEYYGKWQYVTKTPVDDGEIFEVQFDYWTGGTGSGELKNFVAQFEIPESGVIAPEGTTLWGDFFGDEGNGSQFASAVPVSDYLYSGRVGFEANANRVTYVGDDGVKISTSTQGNVESGHIWFNKSTEGSLEVNNIKLYGATKLTYTHTKSKGTLIVSYDAGEGWVQLTDSSDDVALNSNFGIQFEVPEGTKSIKLKLEHPSTDSQNTRVDNIGIIAGYVDDAQSKFTVYRPEVGRPVIPVPFAATVETPVETVVNAPAAPSLVMALSDEGPAETPVEETEKPTRKRKTKKEDSVATE